jgi:hypothetical protein
VPWVRIDEKAMEHPKVRGLADGSFRLWVEGLAHCQKFLTDGLIERVSLRGLLAFSPKRQQALIDARLWDADVDGVRVHDYLKWNDSREHVDRVREQALERIARLRGKKERLRNAVTAREQSANATRSYSGDVSVCISSASSSKAEEGSGETALSMRAGNFCQWYEDTHDRLFRIGYIGTRGDHEAALRLARKLTDQEMRDAALVWFGQDDDFATKGTRTIPKFASRATDCLRTARSVAS